MHVLRDRHIFSEVDVAAVHTLLGEPDPAFEWLNTAYRERSSRLPWVTLDPRFDSLRAEARFEDLLRRINLPPRGPSTR